MRALATSLLACIAATAIAACGGTSDATPVACLDGAGAYRLALDDAPGKVELAGEVPISECVAQNQRGGDLATVGAAMLEAATALNAEARTASDGAAAGQLGYLLGAAAHGAEDTEGIHADLLRRLTAAARYSPAAAPLPASFRRAYRRGYEVGFARG